MPQEDGQGNSKPGRCWRTLDRTKASQVAIFLALAQISGARAFAPFPFRTFHLLSHSHLHTVHHHPARFSLCRLSMQAEKPSALQGKIDAAIYDLKQQPVMAAGDAAAMLIFSAIGRVNHGSDDGSILATALPFLLSWFLVAPMLGAYKKAQINQSLTLALTTALPAWATSVPIGCFMRGLLQGRMPATPFWIVAMVAVGVLVGGWRAAYFQANIVTKTVNEFTEAILDDDD